MDQKNKLSSITIRLHWLVGLSMICLFVMGVYMAENDVLSLYPWHKSFGIFIFLIALARVVWRSRQGWPVPVGVYSKVEQVLAKLVHWVLILSTLLLPISGMVFSAASGHGFAFFGVTLVASNPSLDKAGEVIAYNPFIANAGHEAHEILGWIMMVAVGLHVLGALKHHLLDKDGTLKRMLGRVVE